MGSNPTMAVVFVFLGILLVYLAHSGRIKEIWDAAFHPGTKPTNGGGPGGPHPVQKGHAILNGWVTL